MGKSLVDLNDLVSDDTKIEAACLIRDWLLKHADGDAIDPLTWESLARSRGITVQQFHSPGGEPGWSNPRIFDDSGYLGGRITINTAYRGPELARIWIHELTHMIIAAWCPPRLRSQSDCFCYAGDDQDSVAHDIARVVEELLVGASVFLD